jgi:predicted acyl esterase
VNLTDSIVRVGGDVGHRGGGPKECVVDLAATSNLFRAGHRIALHVTWSSFPRWLPISRGPGGGETRAIGYEIFHDPARPSHLELPVVGTAVISTMNDRPGSH